MAGCSQASPFPLHLDQGLSHTPSQPQARLMPGYVHFPSCRAGIHPLAPVLGPSHDLFFPLGPDWGHDSLHGGKPHPLYPYGAKPCPLSLQGWVAVGLLRIPLCIAGWCPPCWARCQIESCAIQPIQPAGEKRLSTTEVGYLKIGQMG